jgi:MFS transporter, DHA1 family, inner membrane transport protein
LVFAIKYRFTSKHLRWLVSPLFYLLTIFMTKQQKFILYILACVQFTNIMDFMIMMPMGPILIRAFATTPQGFSALVSAYSLSAGISGFLAAFFVDQFDRKQLLTWAYIGFLIGTFACAVAPNYELMMLARIVAGIFGGLLGSQVLSIVGDLIDYKYRSEGMAVIMAAFSVASVLGVPVGMWLATHLSWHAPFVVVVAVGLVNLLLIYKYLPSLRGHIHTAKGKPNPLQVLTNIGQDANQLRAIALSAVVIFGHFSIIPLLNPYLTHNVGMSETAIPYIYLLGGAVTIITARLVGQLADRRGKYPIFAWAAVLFLVPVALTTHLPAGAPLWLIFTISSLFFLFANARTIPMQALVSGVTTNEQRGGFTSINSSVIQLASGAASMVAGLIVSEAPNGNLIGYNWVGYMAIGFILVGVLLGRYVKPVAQPAPVKPAVAVAEG